ncbi:Protein kinase, putative [Hondaea fermentalgiana]|uniref:Protein kinase, putative n=1 Tax=Hondaea fermentalgiana TaxID=2315210 RepID=A0A2R5GTA2_9STRA|nr:Protein kinase, putative [Hondaea fermentalgiana]|eukprot:GBG31883.1 Protein kinase, putative [Hondaea fermentalgiana]
MDKDVEHEDVLQTSNEGGHENAENDGEHDDSPRSESGIMTLTPRVKLGLAHEFLQGDDDNVKNEGINTPRSRVKHLQRPHFVRLNFNLLATRSAPVLPSLGTGERALFNLEAALDDDEACEALLNDLRESSIARERLLSDKHDNIFGILADALQTTTIPRKNAPQAPSKPSPPQEPSSGAVPGLAVARLRLSAIAQNQTTPSNSNNVCGIDSTQCTADPARHARADRAAALVLGLLMERSGRGVLSDDRVPWSIILKYFASSASMLQGSWVMWACDHFQGAQMLTRLLMPAPDRVASETSVVASSSASFPHDDAPENDATDRDASSSLSITSYGRLSNGDGDIYIIMQRAKSWMETLLRIYVHIADALAFIASHGVTHYDVRMDNILLLPHGEGGFDPVLADFGEAFCAAPGITEEEDMVLANKAGPVRRPSDDFQYESRGTECIMAPEMLTVCEPSQAQRRANHDRRQSFRFGTSAPADVWALGCLLFEVATGDFLYQEALDAWATFFARLTQQQQRETDALPLLPESARERFIKACLGPVVPEEQEKLSTEADAMLSSLVVGALQTDPRRRPTATAMRDRAVRMLGSPDQMRSPAITML